MKEKTCVNKKLLSVVFILLLSMIAVFVTGCGSKKVNSDTKEKATQAASGTVNTPASEISGEKSDLTDKSDITESAKNTPAAKPTDSGKATLTPKPTKADEPTPTPKPTKADKATSTPKPTKADKATPTPTPTKADKLTSTPKTDKTTPKLTATPTPEKPKGLKFRYEDRLTEHFQKHGSEFGYKTAEEYLAGANRVIASPDALHKKEAEDGDDVYYLEATNEIVFVSGDGYIRTYFKPSSGIDYYNRQ